MLESLAVERFRTFRSLAIPRLGKVNLIVGKNNVGKTMLLEALRLYTALDAFEAVRALLLGRDEIVSQPSREASEENVPLRISALFHGRPMTTAEAGDIKIGPVGGDPEEILTISLVALRQGVPEAQGGFRYDEVSDDVAQSDFTAFPGLRVSRGGRRRVAPFSRLSDTVWRFSRRSSVSPLPGIPFISARGVNERELAQWWDSLALRDAEGRVTECLRIIAPVDRVTMIEHPIARGGRMAMVRLEGEKEPVPLKSLGDGMLRLFQIAVASEVAATTWADAFPIMLFPESARTTVPPPLLIDEAENGIHYTVLPRLWSFIFRVAELHQIQVFATSHSWDCIAGFQLASADAPHIDACLVRLEQTPTGTRAVVFDRDELGTVTREHIEVR